MSTPIPAGATLGDPVPQPQSVAIPQGATLGDPIETAQPAQPQGPTIGPRQENDPDTLLSPAAGPFERGAMKIASPFARKLMDAMDKLREVESFTPEGRQEHPIQAHMGDIANRIEGFLFGNPQHQEAGIGSGQYGMLTNPALAATQATPGAAEAAGAIESGIKGLATAKPAAQAAAEVPKVAEAAQATTKPGLIKQVLKGEKVAQEPAKTAIRSAVGTEEGTPLLKGHESAADELLSSIKERETAAYKLQDETAGFDVKETRAKLKQAEWKIKQPEIDEAARERLSNTITESKQSIADAEKRLSDAGIDPKAADTLFKQRKAGEEFKKALVQNVSHDGETVNIDGLLNSSKKLRNTPKGDRLEQFMGKEGAEKFMEDLQKAKEMGADALDTQKLAKTIARYAVPSAAGVGGIIYGLAK